MTKREFLTEVIAGNVGEEVIEKATEILTKLDEANEKRREKAAKVAEANAPLRDAIVEHLSEQTDPLAASEVGVALGMTTSKAASLLKGLREDGLVVGERPVKSKPYVYSVPSETEEE